jgi:ADP-ribose pyrophosphatase YjhB (NUDIX family)
MQAPEKARTALAGQTNSKPTERSTTTRAQPGRFKELGESISHTARREGAEETGLELETGALVTVLSSPEWTEQYPNGDVVQNLEHCFVMNGYDPSLQIVRQGSEVADIRFFPLDDIPENTAACVDIEHRAAENRLRYDLPPKGPEHKPME